jgi:PAS domain S-box-containing protein
MKLSLRSKLLLPILPLLAVLAFLLLTALLPYQGIKADISDLRLDVSKTVALGDLGIALSRQMTEYFKLIASGGAEDKFQEALNNTQQSLARLKKEMAMHTGSEQDAEAGHALEEIAGQYAELNHLCQTGLELAKSDQRDKALDLIKTKIEPLLEDSLRIKFEQLSAKNGVEFDEDLAHLRGHSDNLITFSRSDLQSNIKNMKGHIRDTLLVFTLARNFSRQMEEYYFLILAQSGGVDEIETARKAAFQVLQSWKINEGGGVGQRDTANKDLEDVENVERDLIKLNQLADPIPGLARQGKTAQALHVLADEVEPLAHGQLANILGESVRHEGNALAESLDNVNKSSSRMQFGLGVFSLLALVIGLGAPWILSRTIISPILELKKAASEVGSGALDTKVSVSSRSELSQLATTFNQMTEALKESRDSLNEANHELEQKVSDRTVALKDSNERLQAELVERKLTEAALRDSEKRYRDIFENAVEGIFQTSPDGGFITANPALARMLGFETPEELIRARDLDGTYYVHAERRVEFKRLLDQHGTVRGFEFEAYRKDGSKIWMSDNVRAVRDASGKLLYYEGTVEDITERKRAEEALRDAERKYRDIYENAVEGIFQIKPGGAYISANPALARMLGFDSTEELISKRSDPAKRRYIDPQRRDEYLRLLAEEGVLRDFEYQDYRKDGSMTWLSDNVRAVRDSEGVLLYCEGTTQDITSRKRVEMALRESEERFRAQYQNMPLPTYTWQSVGGDLVLVEYNHAAEEYTRGRIADLIGKTATELYADSPEVMNYLRRCYLEQTVFSQEVLYRLRTLGEEKYLRVSCAYVAPDLVMVHTDDITERKQAEAALRESEDRYRELFENAKDAIYVHDLSGTYTSVNRAAERLSGYPRGEILGKHFWDFLAPEYRKQVRENLCKKLKETGETNYEVEIINKDGARVPVEVSSRLIYEEGVAVGVQGSARDITERKRAQQALLTYSRRLIAAQEAERGRIARELHDQIGQMLTALKLNLHAIQSARDGREASILIEDNFKMLEEALEQVRDLSVDLRPLLLDDFGLVTALRWYVEQQASRAGVRAEFTGDSLDPDVRFSRELETACFRIAQEALTNVTRHAQAKRVRVRLSRNRDNLVLQIEDDGVGFDIEALQGHTLASATLGLRGMEERAHAVGGRIKINSATRKGTQVFVELPIAMPNGRKPPPQIG